MEQSIAILSGPTGMTPIRAVIRPLVGFLFILAGLSTLQLIAVPPHSLVLHENWFVQSSARIGAAPEAVSSSGFATDGWCKTTVPATVLAAQVASGVFENLFYSDHLLQLSGMGSAPDGGRENPYAVSWWYRTEFDVPRELAHRNLWLHFDGINAKANIWINGKQLANTHDIAGAHRIFELDATSFVRPGASNALAVEVFSPTDHDFGINLVDWVPTPPDKNMGLWRGVYLTDTGPVRLRHPTVATHFADDTLGCAELSVRAELSNDSDRSVEAVVRAVIGEGIALEKTLTLAPGEQRSEMFTPAEFPELRIAKPDVWWPAQWGEPRLHRLAMSCAVDGTISDESVIKFGIREIAAELSGAEPKVGAVFNNNGDFSNISTDERPLLIRVNRRPILIRGGGWCPDMLQRWSRERIQAEFAYLLDMHLNAVRLEGKLEDDVFFDLADEMGLLVLAGWCCGDRWERWEVWESADHRIANESLRTQILRLRHHASLALWMNGSDNHPPADVETTYRQILADAGWPNPSCSSATSVPTSVSGATGVKMTGPYDYVPPAYWLLDTHHFGGAFGFNTETSPGAAVPDLGSLKKFLPAEKLWPVNELWNLHAGAGSLNNNLTHFREGMDHTYGAPLELKDFLRKAYAMNYDGERAMFEAYGRNKYQSTGLIQWMLNNGWPSIYWHLYDYYLQPGAGYFGAKKACEPLHIQYSYDDRSVVVVNNLTHDLGPLTAAVALYNFDLRPTFTREVTLTSKADSVERVLTIPALADVSEVSFVRLTLTDGRGAAASSNFYWIPKTLPTFDWSPAQAKEHPYYTAVTRYEDLTLLNRLPGSRVTAEAAVRRHDGTNHFAVTLHNPSAALAFLVQLKIVRDDTGEEVLPVLWEDNYISLLPGESRTLTARNSAPDAVGLSLVSAGWNVEETRIPLPNAGVQH